MPRRPAKVTQAEIARAIRAAKDAGGGEVIVDGNQIRINVLSKAPEIQPDDVETEPETWKLSGVPK